MLWFLLSLGLALIVIYRQSTRKSITRDGAAIRSAPDCLPLLGHALKFLKPRHELFDWFVRCQRQYGFETISISVPTLPPGVIISDPKNLEFVLKNEALVAKGDFVKSRTWDLFGLGIINASNDNWRAQRKIGLKFFSGKNLELMVEEILPEAYQRTQARLSKHAEDGTVVDMQSVFLDFTSFVMGHMAFDIDLDSTHPFSKAFDYASDQIGRRFQNPLYPVTEFLFGSKFHEALHLVKSFGKKIVNKAKRERSKSAYLSIFTSEEPAFTTLIDALLETFKDQDVVADAALNFLSAGRDTTAQSLTWTLYSIMRHPEALEPLRAEIAKVKSKGNKFGHETAFSMADLQPAELPHLMATFYEALRMYPPIPFEIQECQQDLTLPDGTFLPKSSVVVWCIWAMNRAKETYGDDADQFRPARWFDEYDQFVRRSAWEFPVFQGGPRSCLGQKLAETLAMSLFANVLPAFESAIEMDPPRHAANSLTLPMEGGLPCYVRLRQ